MRIFPWTVVLIFFGMALSLGCGDSNVNKPKPLSEEERQKLDEQMRKMTGKDKQP